MVGEKSGDTERQLLENVEHNQFSVKLFSNSYPGTDTTLNCNRCSTRALNVTLTVPFTHRTGLGKGGRSQEPWEGPPRAFTEARN